MTKTNSTADLFRKYFKYKIISGKKLFFLSVIMGVLSFLQSAVMVLIISALSNDEKAIEEAIKNGVSIYDIWSVSNFIAVATGAVMLGIVIIAALKSFNFYQQRHETDMLGSLPITHRMRFWGDFISGYVISILPYSLICVLSIPFVKIAESYMKTTLYTNFFAYVVLLAFFSLTLLYVFAVLAASVSGRVISSMACVIILVIASMSLLTCSAGFFIDCIAGMPEDEALSKITALTPSLDVLYNRITVLCSEMPAVGRVNDEYIEHYIEQTPSSVFTNILVWIAEIAALTAAAFFLTKFRKAERTGGAFGHKYGYYGVLFVAVTEMFCISYVFSGNTFLSRLYIIAAIFSVIIFAVFEISMRRGWKNFGIGAVVLAGSIAISMGATALVKYTGAFGLVYRLPDISDIVSAEFDDCEFTEREDIEKLRKNHLEFLEKYSQIIETSRPHYLNNTAHTIVYNLKNGETFTRNYAPIWSYRYSSVKYRQLFEECETALENIPLGLKGFEKQLMKLFDKYKPEYCDIQLSGVFGGISIKPEKMREFAEILFAEYTGDTAKDKIIGKAHFYAKNGESVISNTEIELDIYESYVKSIEFAKNKDNAIQNEYDDEILCYEIYHRYGGEPYYYLRILKKELENEKVKELISLLTSDSYTEPIDGSITVRALDFNEYLLVSVNNRERFETLVLEIFAERLANN